MSNSHSGLDLGVRRAAAEGDLPLVAAADGAGEGVEQHLEHQYEGVQYAQQQAQAAEKRDGHHGEDKVVCRRKTWLAKLFKKNRKGKKEKRKLTKQPLPPRNGLP